MDKPSQETWLAYMEQAEGMIKDQQELIKELQKTIEVLLKSVSSLKTRRGDLN